MKKLLLMAVAALLAIVDVNAQTEEPSTLGTETIRLRECRVGTPNPQSALRRSPKLQDGESPYVGNRRQLVVLASFQDRDFKEDHRASLVTWDKIFNEVNFHDDMFVGSVHDYFLAQSYGQFNLMFDLVFVELPDGCQKYRSTNDDDENSQYMVDDIVDALQEQDIDWSLYDWDSDAFVDQLLIIYAGEGMNASSARNTIWPHQWWLSHHLNLETDEEDDYRSFRTIASDEGEYYIDCYCCVQEIVNRGSLKTPFGTICHEYSHCFGFPDFYYDGGNKVVAEWDLMDYGNFNDGGFRPCNYSAHERMLMGWLEPIELTDAVSITDMPALCDEPQAYLIRNDGAENEFYMVENRQQRGWDEKLPGSGILVFHVDYDRDMWAGPYLSPNNYSKKRYNIFPANNITREKGKTGWAYPYIVADSEGNDSIANDKLTNTSEPAATLNNANADGEKLMSKPIKQMSVDDNGLASFVFGESEPVWVFLPEKQEASVEGLEDAWYLPDGRRLSGRPTTRGLYINKGKKVVVP